MDCGITAAREVEFARELGIDVVITDHHECKQAIPEAAAVVDPHRPDCPYPFKGLAGVGVALKLAMAAAGPDRAGLVFPGVRRSGGGGHGGRRDAHDGREPDHRPRLGWPPWPTPGGWGWPS